MTLGVGVIAFDRPQYLRRTLAGLLLQDYTGDVVYHLFLDGAENEHSGRTVGRQAGIDQSKLTFQRMIPSGIVHQQGKNLGIGLHQYAATEQMTALYDRVMMIEDDCAISPHWLRLVEGRFSRKALVEFHTVHKFLLLAHNRKHYNALGKLVANIKQFSRWEKVRIQIRTFFVLPNIY